MSLSPLSFEAALQQLEACVSALEEGGLTLEEALARFEEGMRLVAHCNSLLDAADLRITQLLQEPDGAGPCEATDDDSCAADTDDVPF
ncbi:MAG: exodeoxyribonuclease VII small subunit [Chloroflexi bacterium]|jgi:exodeoxyribonuclease VII small subunit|nr:exodeoxyribonuclease VII small subunit [Chloroflexota bacterium]